MKLAALAAKPKLVKITIDEAEIIERYGEALEFYIYDRQSMETYMNLSQLTENNIDEIVNTILPLVLDEDGTPALDPKDQLPIDVAVKVIEKVTISLGNLASQTLAA